MYGIFQNYLIILPPFCLLFKKLLGTHFSEVFVGSVGKGAHMEQNITGLEAGNKNSKQKMDYQGDGISYKRSSHPKEGVSVLSNDSVQ